MHFAPDTRTTLEFMVALGNTMPGAHERRRRADDPSNSRLLDRARYSGRMDRDERSSPRCAKPATAPPHSGASTATTPSTSVNAMLGEANALPHLIRHDGFDWHLHATGPDAPLAERIRVEARSRSPT